VRDAKLKKLSWLRVSSIDDLEQKVGEIIVAVMVVNLLEMSLHMVRLTKSTGMWRIPSLPFRESLRMLVVQSP
jgi:uncharacterized membrane protein YqhA